MFYRLLADDPDVKDDVSLHYNAVQVTAAVNQDGKPLQEPELQSLMVSLFNILIKPYIYVKINCSILFKMLLRIINFL